MSLVLNSLSILQPPGDNTGSGIQVANIDYVNGMRVFSPSKMKQDGNIVHDKKFVEVNWNVAPTAGGYYIHTVTEGFWQVLRATYSQVVNSTSSTIDVQVCPATTGPTAGTTQLTAVINANTAGNNFLDVLGGIIAAPTTFGPGNRLSVNIGGNTTGMVGNLLVEMIRTS